MTKKERALLAVEALKKEYGMQQLLITERIHNEELSLPISPSLTNEDIERIIDCANTFI